MTDFIFDSKCLINCGNSCFIDTVLISLYTYKKSPFFKFLEHNWIEKNEKDKRDIEIKNIIKKTLKNTINFDTDTSVKTCLLLKNQISQFCKNKNNIDFLNGQHDPNEFYDMFMKIFNYDPMKVTTIRQSKMENSDKIIKEKPVTEEMSYYSISNNGKHFNGLDHILNPQWEDLGSNSDNWKYNNKNIPTYRWTRKNVLSIKSESCLVFHINRTTFRFLNGDIMPCKTENTIKMPTYIKLNDNENYFLFATIIHLGNGVNISHGHYITLLFDRKDYYIYDDLNPKKIKECKVNREKIQKYQEKNGIMYFYYKI